MTTVENDKLSSDLTVNALAFPRKTAHFLPRTFHSPTLTVMHPPPPLPHAPTVCHLSEAPQKMRACRKWAPPSPTLTPLPAPAAHSRRLKPEPQEVVLRSILSGQTNYSPFDKRALLFICFFIRTPFLYEFPCPPLPSRPICCFDSGSSGGRDRKAPYLRYLQSELHSGAKRAAAAVAQTPPPKKKKFREIFLLRCSLKTCGIPAHSIPTTLL